MSAAQHRNSSQNAMSSQKSSSSQHRTHSSVNAKARRAQRRRRVIRNRIIALAAAVAVIAAVIIIICAATAVKNIKDLSIETLGMSQTLKWTPVNEKYSYEILRKDSDGGYVRIGETEAGASSYTAQAEGEVALNTYKVVSLNGRSRSKGKIISDYSGPSDPTAVAAKTVSADSIELTWNASEAATGFDITYSESESMAGSAQISVSASEAKKDGGYAYTVSSLQSNTTYFFQLSAYADVNEKEYAGKHSSGTTEPVSAKVWRSVAMDGIDVNAPMVALTFDDGPDAGGGITDQILNAVESYGGLATFFQCGETTEIYPEVLQKIAAGGHEIGCHTYDHDHYGSEVTRDDIVLANDAIEAACGIRPTAFRSPGGLTTDFIREVCIEEDMPIYYWAVDTRDWESRDTDSVVDIVKNYTYDGAIILMHNVYWTTADAVDIIVPWLLEEGYQLVTVSQLIQAKTGEPPVPGRQYYDYDSFD